jgi:S1-C subfamily serine protease
MPAPAGNTTFPRYTDAKLNALAPSLVRVEFDMPYSAGGIPASSYHGTGLLVDVGRGLVVVDRNTVPVTVGEATVTFAGSLEVPARVLYVHPLHNLSVLAYDPKLIGHTPVRAAQLKARELVTGEFLWVVGMGEDGELKSRSTQIADIGAVQLPLSSTGRFRESNLEAVQLVNPPADYDGVLLDKSSHVIGLWSSFAYENERDLIQENRGVPLDVVVDMIAHVRDGRPLRSLEAEFEMQPLASARDFGLPPEWADKLTQHSVSSRNVLTVVRTVAGSPAATLLQQGDLMLAIDGEVVTRFREVERAVGDKQAVQVTVWRSNTEHTIEVPTAILSGVDIDRFVEWGGATLHAPHRALSVQRSIPPTGVYIGDFAQGSPATRSGLFPGQRITEVDGVPTPDLDAFVAAVKGRADRVSVRLKTIGWNNAAGVITLKLDKHYWPAYELRRAESGWERRALE